MDDKLTANLGFAFVILFFCVVFHASSLFGLARLVFADRIIDLRHKSVAISLTIFSTLCFVVLFIHGVEIALWALLYHGFGSVESVMGAFIHSMGAFTTYGASRYNADNEWNLITHLEAMNGLVAFGLTTAFLYSASGRLHDSVK